jgi:hypothetical protein
MRIVKHHRRSHWFDDVGEVGVGKASAQRVDRRRRKDDIADLPQPDEQNSDVG